jgi:acyl-CoA reductase-like NAD-dependent aldehyde dehydrogenase
LEIPFSTALFNYWIENGAKFLADEDVAPAGVANAVKQLKVFYEPYPLVGVITPWNGPLAGPCLDIPPALMAGCAVLSKPSEYSPLVWQAAVAGWKEIGAPDVLEAVYGFGEPVRPSLISSTSLCSRARSTRADGSRWPRRND